MYVTRRIRVSVSSLIHVQTRLSYSVADLRITRLNSFVKYAIHNFHVIFYNERTTDYAAYDLPKMLKKTPEKYSTIVDIRTRIRRPTTCRHKL